MNIAAGKASPSGASTGEDVRIAFVYDEALRGLAHQQAMLESLFGRAGMLIFAVSFASSLLGSTALSDGLGVWDWLAVGLLLAIGALVAVMLWPYYRYSFRFDPEELLRDYVDADEAMTLTQMHRSLALRIKRDMIENWRVIRWIRWACELALVLLLLEMVAWLVAIGRG